MPSREPELYKDKIEVSLDGRQIFYLFFGGAVIVGLVFVLGVMVGRRVEARGHLDRADTQTASDPLAALDKLERSDDLSFHGALTGSEASTDVEKTIGELDRRRAAAKPGAAGAPSAEVRADKPEDKAGKADKPEARPDPEADRPKTDKREGDKREGDKREGDKREGDKREGDKREAEKKAKKHDDDEDSDAKRSDAKDKPVTRPESREARTEGKAEARSEGKSEGRSDGKSEGKTEGRSDGKSEGKTDGKSKSGEGKARYTLQLSSFHDRSEAEAFLSSMKSAGFQPYVTEAEVSGKGTFYRVRLGSYRSMEAANDAKEEFEKAAKKSAQVMRL